MKPISFFILSIAFLASSCHRDPVGVLPPNTFYFQLLKSGEPLPDSSLSAIRMFYIDDHGSKVYGYTQPPGDTEFVYPPGRYTSGLDSVGVLAGPYVSYILGNKNTHNCYLEYPNGDVDTIYVEQKLLTQKEGAKDRCYCTTPFTKVMFNGKDAPISTSLKADDGKAVFVFEK